MKPEDVLAAVKADGFTSCLSDGAEGTLLSWIAHDRRLHAFFDRERNLWSYWTLSNRIPIYGPHIIGDLVPELRAVLEKLAKETR